MLPHLKYVLALITVCSFSFSNAHARMPAQGWQLALGGGLLLNPAFKGAKDYQLSLVPYFRLTYNNFFFASVGEGAGFNIINTKNWKAGPLVKYRFKREEGDGSSPFRIAGSKTNALMGLGDVDGTFEPGLFASYRFNNLRFKVEARDGISGHEGWVVDLSIAHSESHILMGKPFRFSIGPKTTLVSKNYNLAYYGIDIVQANRSGLPTYTADSGMLLFGIGFSGNVALSNRLSMVVFAGIDRLTGDAANSPLVKQRGSRNQGNLGVFFAYRIGK